MTPYPKISIVTPSFNQGHYLEETIQSVLNQNYPNLEYIIIDGGSTDNSVEIIKKYEKHLKYWVSEPDNGQSHAINKGLQHCTGEIFNWINSDDYYIENALFHVGEAFMENENIDILAAKEYTFNYKDKELTKGTLVSDDFTETLFWSIYDQPCTFIRLKAFKNILPINDQFHFVMDSEMYTRYLLRNGTRKILKIDTPLTMFRLHDESKSVSLGMRFRKEKHIIEYEILRLVKASFLLKQYVKSQRARKQALNYSVSPGLTINKDLYTKLFCVREIPRLNEKKINIIEKLCFLPYYFRYNTYSGAKLFKCFLADYMFPTVYKMVKKK